MGLRIFLQGDAQGLHHHGQQFPSRHLFLRLEAQLSCQILSGENPRRAHPLGKEAAVRPLRVGIVIGLRRAQDGDGYRGLPGGFAAGIRGGIGKGIHSHLVVLRSVGEAALRSDLHAAPPGLPGDGIGQGFSFRILGQKLSCVGYIFIGFQRRVLGFRGLVFFPPNAQAQGRFRLQRLPNRVIPQCCLSVRLCQVRSEDRLVQLLCRQSVPRLQDPVRKSECPAFRHLQQENPPDILPKLPGRKAIFIAALHRCSLGRNGQHQAQGQ